MINNVGKKSVIVCDEATAQSMENRANAVAKLAENRLFFNYSSNYGEKDAFQVRFLEEALCRSSFSP